MVKFFSLPWLNRHVKTCYYLYRKLVRRDCLGASFVATKVTLRYLSPVTVVWLRLHGRRYPGWRCFCANNSPFRPERISLTWLAWFFGDHVAPVVTIYRPGHSASNYFCVDCRYDSCFYGLAWRWSWVKNWSGSKSRDPRSSIGVLLVLARGLCGIFYRQVWNN